MLAKFLSSYSSSREVEQVGSGHLKNTGVAAILLAQALSVMPMATQADQSVSPLSGVHTLEHVVQSVDFNDAFGYRSQIFENPLIDNGVVVLNAVGRIDHNMDFLKEQLGDSYINKDSMRCMFDEADGFSKLPNVSSMMSLNHSDSPDTNRVSVVTVNPHDIQTMIDTGNPFAEQYEARAVFYHELYHAGYYNSTTCDAVLSSKEVLLMENAADSFAYMMITKDMLNDGHSLHDALSLIDAKVGVRHDELQAHQRDTHYVHSTHVSLVALHHMLESGEIDVSNMTPKDMEHSAFQLSMATHESLAMPVEQNLTKDTMRNLIENINPDADKMGHVFNASMAEMRLLQGYSHMLPAQARFHHDYEHNFVALSQLNETQREAYIHNIAQLTGGELSSQESRSLNAFFEKHGPEMSVNDIRGIAGDVAEVYQQKMAMGGMSYQAYSDLTSTAFVSGIESPLGEPASERIRVPSYSMEKPDWSSVADLKSDSMTNEIKDEMQDAVESVSPRRLNADVLAMLSSQPKSSWEDVANHKDDESKASMEAIRSNTPSLQ